MLIKINVLHATGHHVKKDYGVRVIDASKIDEILFDKHVQARDKNGEPVPDVGKERQYEPKACRLVRYLEGAGAQPIHYFVRGTLREWEEKINAARVTQVLSLDQPDPEPATDA